MRLHKLRYYLVFISPAVLFASIYFGGALTCISLIYVFMLVPGIELLYTGTTLNLDPTAEEIEKNDKTYDYILYSLVFVQVGMMLFFLYKVSLPDIALLEKIGYTISFGLSCGVLGINVAHELGHRNTPLEQTMAKILLATSQYMHFFIEHNRGHHKNVSTEYDPASARFGESLYAFFLRSIPRSWLSAWHLEADRLKKNNQSVWSIHNEMLQYQLIQAAILLSIFYYFGIYTTLFYFAAACIGFLLLETVNYIEHYGLRRKKIGPDFYEKTLPIHSWNSNHALGRILLLEVTRHSDHHYMANRKYQVLRHFDQSPQMPTGYPGMMLLSFFPPLWFNIMHRRIHEYKASKEGVHLA
jgi:alkane 1-monooxygenase